MELVKTSLILSAILCLSSCAPGEQEMKGTEQSKLMASEQSNEQHEDCFDNRMEIWFDSFNDYQAQGLSMQEADRKASEFADKAYNDCLASIEKLASEESADKE
jgi:hypothetical protein